MIRLNKDHVVVVSAVRTAIGSFNGSLKNVSAVKLGAAVIEAALQKINLNPELVDEVIMGNVLQAGLGQNPARQAAILAGIPQTTSSFTINKVCGSGLKTVHLAAQAILSGESEIVVAGGMENMSQSPYLLEGVREGYKMGHQKVEDSMIKDGLWCAFNDYHMGTTAENLAEKYTISREEQDQFALESQQKAEAAMKAERFVDEIVPIVIPQRKGDDVVFKDDEFPKFNTTMNVLEKLKPAFKKDGTVTAANASGINDGAAALVLMKESKAIELGLKPLVKLVGNATAGVDPSIMGIGAAAAIKKVLEKTELTIDDMDLIEANEAFAVQSIAVSKECNFDPAKVNVNGGAIALGHPIGASGARILVTLIHELKRRDESYGVAGLCIGGGQGVASIVGNIK